MERGPLSNEAFGAFAKRVELFCYVDSKLEGAKYPNLLREKDGAGYPYVCFLNAEGNVIAKQGRAQIAEHGVDAFVSTLDTHVKKFTELRAKASKGDKKAVAAFFMLRFDLGHLKTNDLQGAMQAKWLDADQKALVQERLIQLRVDETLKGLDQDKPETFGPYAKKLMAQHKGLGLPEGPAGFTAWYVILEDAYRRKDAKTFELAFTAMRAAGARHPTFIKQRQKQLAELKAAKKNKSRTPAPQSRCKTP